MIPAIGSIGVREAKANPRLSIIAIMASRCSFYLILVLAISCMVSGSLRAEPAKKLTGKIMVIGDSLADGLGLAIHNRLKTNDHVQVIRRAKVGTGLIRKDVFDWPDRFNEMLMKEKPTIAVAAFGLNDWQGAYDEKRQVVPIGSANWDRHYGGLVERMIDLAAENGVVLVWIGLPVVRSDLFDGHLSRINSILAGTTKRRGTVFIPIRELTASKAGDYTPVVADAKGRSRELRAPDGVHFTGFGYDLLAEHILDTISASLPVSDQEMERVADSGLATAAKDAAAGDAAAKDAAAGDAVAGDAVAGDSATRDSAAKDSAAKDSAAEPERQNIAEKVSAVAEPPNN